MSLVGTQLQPFSVEAFQGISNSKKSQTQT